MKLKKKNPIYATNLKEFMHHYMRNYIKVANDKINRMNKTPNTYEIYEFGVSMFFSALFIIFILFYIICNYHHPQNTHRTRRMTQRGKT